MKSASTLGDLRLQVVDAAKTYFQHAFPVKSFVPGETYIPASGKVMTEDDLALLIDAALDMVLTAGRFADDLERDLATKLGRRPHALLVNSGSSANLLAISSLTANTMADYDMAPMRPGDEVITVAAGFPTTVNPLVQNGFVPVFVDVDFQTLNALPEKIMQARTRKTRAIILAHTLGNPFRADRLQTWCDDEGLYLIEDSCDALGSEILSNAGNRLVGSFGDYSTFSFYPAHHITTGEGGAVLARSHKLRRVAESVRDWGRDCWCEPGKDNTCGKRFSWEIGDMPAGYDHKYIYSNIGYNLKITDMQAALGVSQLKRVDDFIEKRRENWNRLVEGIRASPTLRDKFLPVLPTEDTRPSWFGLPLHCAEGVSREQVVRQLEERKVGTRLVFAGNITKQKAYRNVNYRVVGELTNTDQIMRRTFWMGVYPGIRAAQRQYMLESLESVAKSL